MSSQKFFTTFSLFLFRKLWIQDRFESSSDIGSISEVSSVRSEPILFKKVSNFTARLKAILNSLSSLHNEQ